MPEFPSAGELETLQHYMGRNTRSDAMVLKP